MERNFCKIVENSIKENWNEIAFCDFESHLKYKYSEVGIQIKKLHILFEEYGIQKGDKIALLGRNSSNWGILFFAVTTYGVVVVPILADFIAPDVEHIVYHSETKILFASNSFYNLLNKENLKKTIKGSFCIENFKLFDSFDDRLTEIFNSLEYKFIYKYPEGIKAEDYTLPYIDGNELMEISYTSGTSGNSKGVMLTGHNIMMNMIFAQDVNMPIYKGDNTLAFLPMAHSFGLAYDLMFHFIQGCHNYFLTKLPSPQILLKALSEVRPPHILTVPLIVEKIYFNKIKAKVSTPFMQILLTIPGINNIIYSKIRKKLLETFGGNLYEIIIGGAPMNPKVEKFLKKINFPFTIGYGMTECAPLISYAPYNKFRLTSCGQIIRAMDVRIDSTDQYNIAGEIQVKGEHVMIGYYKNTEATKSVFTEDGWLKTGDVGVIDKDGFIYIKGRCKSMLLGPSGQNIYPEEIESQFVNYEYVEECLAVQRGNRIVVLIYPKMELAQLHGMSKETIESLLNDYRNDLNKKIPTYMNISYIEMVEKEFEKTPKKSIKRFLYN